MIRFADIAVPTPSNDSLAASTARIDALLDRGERAAALAEWDRLRRETESWSSLVHLRFAQDTTDAAAKAAREYADALAPIATGHDIALKRRLLADPDRNALAALAGRHVLRLWETDVTTFDPAIAGALVEEARLGARYTELLAGARFEIGGENVNLAGLARYAEDPDPATAPKRCAGRSSPPMATSWTASSTHW